MKIAAIPTSSIGIGLRHPHYTQFLEELPTLGFLEVHSENFFHAGGASLHVLEHARAHYPISLHGVGLSLASADTRSDAHLAKLKNLVERIEPALVSEHLCWSAIGGKHFNDLLPFPYTQAALDHLIERVDHVQNFLKRRILIENLSAYLQFAESQMDEFSFLNELAERSGCGILLDVNNLYVNACNFDYDPWPLLQKLNPSNIGEIHLAGHTRTEDGLIDTHSDVVCDPVWQLYQRTLAYFGNRPTLIEWDADIPALEILLQQAHIALDYQRALPSGAKGKEPAIATKKATRPESMHTLAQAQQSFGAALLSSLNTEAAIPLFLASPQIVMDRLALYRGNVVASVTKALQAAYPVIERIVGAEFFAALARAYWQRYPSEEGDLYHYGAHFADFIATFPHTQALPYLPDVAQLEWAVHHAYAAADPHPLKLIALAKIPPEQIGQLRFNWQAATHLQHSDFPIASIWQQHQADYTQEIEITLTEPEDALVYRQNDHIRVEKLSPDQFVFLQQLQCGNDLQTAVSAVLEHAPHFAVDQALAQAFHQELFISLRREHDAE